MEISIKGILAIEHTLQTEEDARMRVIFFARPKDCAASLKSKPDHKSQGAAWLSLAELRTLAAAPSCAAPSERLRSQELLEWGGYVDGGGMPRPTTLLVTRAPLPHYYGP